MAEFEKTRKVKVKIEKKYKRIKLKHRHYCFLAIRPIIIKVKERIKALIIFKSKILKNLFVKLKQEYKTTKLEIKLHTQKPYKVDL